MSSSILRGLNSTNTPLLANGIFLGEAEFVGSLLTVLVNCYANTEIKVEIFEYSTPALTVAVPISTSIIPALTYQQIEANINFQYVKLVITNTTAINQTVLNINTVYTNLLPLGAGLLNPSGTVPISGNVNVSNLITETLATRRVDFLVVGTFYRVASVGITTGAEWNVIGAIVNGESVPVIGRLFKCLAIGPAVAGGGECYDVEYTTTVSLSDPSTVRVRDTYGDPILTTAGNLMVGISNIYTANPLHTIVDSGSISINTSGNTIKIDQTSTATNGVSVNPTAIQATRIVSLGNTALLISTGGLCYGSSLINKSPLVNCWVKFYVKATAPTATDTPFLIQYLEYVAQYNLNSHNDEWFNMPIGSSLWVRASLLSTDADATDTGIDAEATVFLGT